MQWYMVKLVFKIQVGNGSHQAQFDEQFKLVKAGSVDGAHQRGSVIGWKEETSFQNQKGQEVRWSFVNVAQVVPLGRLRDGMELFSQIREVEDAESYQDFVQHLSNKHQLALI